MREGTIGWEKVDKKRLFVKMSNEGWSYERISNEWRLNKKRSNVRGQKVIHQKSKKKARMREGWMKDGQLREDRISYGRHREC